MDLSDVVALRLSNEHLIGAPLKNPQSVVRSLGAVQAQDFTGATWALGLRCNATETEVRQAFDDGKLLRTHILRPTWHFVAPDDIRWMQTLTAPRVLAASRYYFKKAGLDAAIFRKSNQVLAKILQGNNHLTRTEIAHAYKTAGIDASGLRLGYLLMHAELDALICSGAMRGKQHTYALVDERAPHAKPLPYDEALKKLTIKYFTSHGPAQMQDFAWWASLTIAEIKKGLAMAASELTSETIGGKTFWFSKHAKAHASTPPLVHLLPNYDEFLIAYKDHSPLISPTMKPMDTGTSNLIFGNHIIVLDGLVVGGWKRAITTKQYEITLTLAATLSPAQQQAISKATKRLHDFTGLPVKLT